MGDMATDLNGGLSPMVIERLLGRPEVLIEADTVMPSLKDQVILVTGAGGTIGSEICRQLLRCMPRTVIALDWDEQGVYTLDSELAPGSPKRFKSYLGNAANRRRVERIMIEHRPQVVFHVAAYKHVHYVERFPEEGVANNVFGTRTIAELAVEHDVSTVVFVSTDKAVQPTSVYGATKSLCERVIRDFSWREKASFVTVRFGNVMASRGSVIPRLDRQIMAGGPLTITLPEAERYFMTAREAAGLVLQSSHIGTNGDLCLRRMEPAIRILDLAHRLMELRGVSPDSMAIEYIGMAPGEKVQESLLTAAETTRFRDIDGAVVCARGERGDDLDSAKFRALENAASEGERDALLRLLADLVPDYTSLAIEEAI